MLLLSPGPRWRRLALHTALLPLLAGCTDASEMFSGRWATTAPIALDEGVDLRLELGIGHFGPDLVGVLRLQDPLGAPLGECPCAIVEGAGVSLSEGTMNAFAALCPAVAETLGSPWGLTLTLEDKREPRRLVGLLARHDAEPLALALEERDAFVDETFKACP
jgi:hypothetical protein